MALSPLLDAKVAPADVLGEDMDVVTGEGAETDPLVAEVERGRVLRSIDVGSEEPEEDGDGEREVGEVSEVVRDVDTDVDVDEEFGAVTIVLGAEAVECMVGSAVAAAFPPPTTT